MHINKDFEEWWDENEKQFMADACHMSEFHMASVVWEAAIQYEREACAIACDRQAQLQMDTGADDCCIAEAKRCARDIRMRPNVKVSGPEAALSPEGRAQLPGSAAVPTEKG